MWRNVYFYDFFVDFYMIFNKKNYSLPVLDPRVTHKLYILLNYKVRSEKENDKYMYKVLSQVGNDQPKHV